jgi:hypothetical protein
MNCGLPSERELWQFFDGVRSADLGVLVQTPDLFREDPSLGAYDSQVSLPGSDEPVSNQLSLVWLRADLTSRQGSEPETASVSALCHVDAGMLSH